MLPQFEYTFVDNQWYLPYRYYSVRPATSEDATPISITAYDTSVYLDKYLKSTSAYFTPELAYGSNPLLRQSQVQWLTSTLSKAKASQGWSILVGHHPLVSANVADGAFVPLNATIASAIGANPRSA